MVWKKEISSKTPSLQRALSEMALSVLIPEKIATRLIESSQGREKTVLAL